MMRARWLLVVLVLVVLLAAGGAVVVTSKLSESQKTVRRELRAAAFEAGLDPDFVDAIGYVEGPRWKLDARSTDPRDEARGGSFGPTQISEKTARAHGFTGSMEEFREDPATAAAWTATILLAAHRRRKLSTLADYVAAWNAGRDDADKNNDGELEELPAAHPTRAVYLPLAKRGLAYVQANPLGVA